MQDLTFGEQVKIILSRKDMTIKELAKKIEVRTGKKMSRQNLTQRLGRDNFQERDMRMIAEIMGCPFQLNILDERTITENEIKAEQKAGVKSASETVGEIKETKAAQTLTEEPQKADKNKMPDAKPDVEKEKDSHVTAHERDITIGELVDIHEELDALMEKNSGKHLTGKESEAKQNEPAVSDGADGESQSDQTVHPEEYAKSSPSDQPGEPEQAKMPVDSGGRMQGKADGCPVGHGLGDAPDDSSEYAQRNVNGYPGEYIQENAAAYQTDYDEARREEYEEYSGGAPEGYEEGAGREPVGILLEEIDSLEKTEKKETVQEEKTHGWRAYLKQRFKKLNKDQTHPDKETAAATYPALGTEDPGAQDDGYPETDYPEEEYLAGAYEGGYSEIEYSDRIYDEEYQSAEYSEEAYLEELAKDEEDRGEINPYTGKEYESNSVRMHPSRIGYVQVYDRMNHQWTDMTEWAFLGYQERKKQLLGKDYDPPIYLD